MSYVLLIKLYFDWTLVLVLQAVFKLDLLLKHLVFTQENCYSGKSS